MEWHMNDLSVNGQFPNAQALKNVLEPLLAMRHKSADFRGRFFISRTLGNQSATPVNGLYQAIQSLADKNFKTVASRWLSGGPFWNDERCVHDDDYFEFEGDDVTEQGLGESARRQIIGIDVEAVSLTNSGKNCEQTPLRIQHGLSEGIFDHYDVLNIWNIAALEASISASRPEPRNWDEFLNDIQSRFDDTLIISDTACEKLRPTPFSRSVVNRSLELLCILSRLVTCRNDDGSWTQEGQELYKLHFQGDKAWFSDESEANKVSFEAEMTFLDPECSGQRLFCPMHGKIKTPQTRVHFAWPVPAKEKLKVVYIGPKITKA